MSMNYIRETYRVPAEVGGRIEYTGAEAAQLGTIKGAKGAHLEIHLDGDTAARRFHPTWKLRYLDDANATGSAT
ncbi:hypothetical protein [Variovorax sp. GB1P17]|uniref:hypothetical protein n=1 Tax=Variovorax sp. GB1P17 TaxID=3443740 RepID=UPI003F461CA4